MTDEKAIKILVLALVYGISRCNDDDRDAIKKGIEALREKLERKKGGKLWTT